MISQSKIKQVRSLEVKKYRHQEGLFIIEGGRTMATALEAGAPIQQLYLTEEFLHQPAHRELVRNLQESAIAYEIVAPEALQKMSPTVTPAGILGLCTLPANLTPDSTRRDNWLYLDRIGDPGNLGTLLRSAAWFGVKWIALSPGCSDAFNPKVVRSGMGAHFQVSLHSGVDLALFKRGAHILYAADPHGTALEKLSPAAESPWVLVVGSEAHGISRAVRAVVDRTVAIPRLGSGESLNVAVATGILLYQLTRAARAPV